MAYKVTILGVILALGSEFSILFWSPSNVHRLPFLSVGLMLLGAVMVFLDRRGRTKPVPQRREIEMPEFVMQLIGEDGTVLSESRTTLGELRQAHETGTCGAFCGFCYDEFCQMVDPSCDAGFPQDENFA